MAELGKLNSMRHKNKMFIILDTPLKEETILHFAENGLLKTESDSSMEETS
jgi:hypothetical protein